MKRVYRGYHKDFGICLRNWFCSFGFGPLIRSTVLVIWLELVQSLISNVSEDFPQKPIIQIIRHFSEIPEDRLKMPPRD